MSAVELEGDSLTWQYFSTNPWAELSEYVAMQSEKLKVNMCWIWIPPPSIQTETVFAFWTKPFVPHQSLSPPKIYGYFQEMLGSAWSHNFSTTINLLVAQNAHALEKNVLKKSVDQLKRVQLLFKQQEKLYLLN